MIPLELLGVSQADKSGLPVVLLRNENRVLPILVGLPEARAIQIVLMGETPPRPLTHDLICNLLAGLRGQLKSVTIYKLEHDIFFAHLNIEQKSASGEIEQILKVDSRPSDSIAIAVRMGCPIFAAEEVMEAAGQDASIITEAEEEEGPLPDMDSDADDEGEPPEFDL